LNRIEVTKTEQSALNKVLHTGLSRALVACACLVVLGTGWAQETQQTGTAPAPKPFDVKGTFRNICGFCHEDYGRHAGKGPQLMNSERSEEFMLNRIKKGMPGRMAAFGSVYSDDQIRQIVKFIRNLKPDVEPDNP
jgi:cytochrome c553